MLFQRPAITLLLVAVITASIGYGLLRISGSHTIGQSPDSQLVRVYCAAVIRPAIEQLTKRFSEQHQIPIVVDYGGTGVLLARQRLHQACDLFISADRHYVDQLIEDDQVSISHQIATVYPVVVYRLDNERTQALTSLADAVGSRLKIGIGDPRACAIGRVTASWLASDGLSDELDSTANPRVVTKPSVAGVLADVLLGAVDLAIVWDSMVAAQPELSIAWAPNAEALARSITPLHAEISVTRLRSDPNEHADQLYRFLTRSAEARAAMVASGLTVADPKPADGLDR